MRSAELRCDIAPERGGKRLPIDRGLAPIVSASSLDLVATGVVTVLGKFSPKCGERVKSLNAECGVELVLRLCEDSPFVLTEGDPVICLQ